MYLFLDVMNFQFTGLYLSGRLSRVLRPVSDPAALPEQRLEPEQHASPGCLCADSRYSRHLWDEVTLAVRGHVLLLLLLAY